MFERSDDVDNSETENEESRSEKTLSPEAVRNIKELILQGEGKKNPQLKASPRPWKFVQARNYSPQE
jgi:hypothetical protein